jgi:Galactose oxidase, central domain/Kelch motif
LDIGYQISVHNCYRTTMIEDGSYIWTWTKIEAQPDPQHGVPIPRSSHGVSYLAHSDTLIVYGGEHVARTPIEDEAASCWICRNITTASSAAWQRIDCSSLSRISPPSRIAHAQALYDDRYLYVFGGRAGITMQEQAMNDLWVLDTADFTWNQVIVDSSDEGSNLPEARSFHRMICIGTNLYVFGGCGAQHGRLNDLYKFDIRTKTWQFLGLSHHLRGRGGPNLLSLQSGRQLAVVAGFAGEETADGHVYTIAKSHNDNDETYYGAWEADALTPLLQGMRPRSVCASASFAVLGMAIIFGGEVDPSDKGHEGAGAFENDIVVLEERTGAYLSTRKAPTETDQNTISWPEKRGWSAAASTESPNGTGNLFLFGGLAGDDANPKRLNDLWRLDIQKSK